MFYIEHVKRIRCGVCFWIGQDEFQFPDVKLRDMTAVEGRGNCLRANQIIVIKSEIIIKRTEMVNLKF